MPFDIYYSFLPECHLDTNLVEALLNKPGCVNHNKGVSKIMKSMSIRLAHGFAVASIDDDKVVVDELRFFSKIDRLCRRSLMLYARPDRKHFVIQVSPALERWILAESEKGKISLTDYGLPTTVIGLKKLKGEMQRNDPRFKRLFQDMTSSNACDEIIEMKRWLCFFRDNHINSNIELL